MLCIRIIEHSDGWTTDGSTPGGWILDGWILDGWTPEGWTAGDRRAGDRRARHWTAGHWTAGHLFRRSVTSTSARQGLRSYCRGPLTSSPKVLYIPGLGEQSGVLNDSMIKVYPGNRNIDEILKFLKKKWINQSPRCRDLGQECKEPGLASPSTQRFIVWHASCCEITFVLYGMRLAVRSLSYWVACVLLWDHLRIVWHASLTPLYNESCTASTVHSLLNFGKIANKNILLMPA